MKTFLNTTDSTRLQETRSKSLNDLKNGESTIISQIKAECQGLERRRLLDLGFVPGTKVTKLGQGLFNGPTRFAIRGNVIALRDNQSSSIFTQ